jgi:peptidoglycan/xylan/chitin deacetylase (PgdA/CDA1 family)
LLRRGYRPATAAGAAAGRARALHVTFDDAYRSVASVLPALERLGVPVTIFACSGYAQDGRPLDVPELAAEARAFPDELSTMDWEMLRGCADRGVEIGSHTKTHPHLPELADDELARELRESRDAIEYWLGRACRFLAYPYGEENARVRRAARAAGYEAAFALKSDERDFDRFALPRVALFRGDRRLRATLKTTATTRRAARFVLERLGRA